MRVKKLIIDIESFFDTRSDFERKLFVVSISFVVLLLLFFFIIKNFLNNIDHIQSEIRSSILAYEDNKVLLKKIELDYENFNSDFYQDHVNKLVDKDRELDDAILKKVSKVNTVSEAQSILREALKSHQGIEVLSIKNLAKRQIDVSTNAQVLLNEMGFLVKINANYLDVLSLLQSLEEDRYGFYLDRLSLSIIEYPIAEVDLYLKTLIEANLLGGS